MAERPEEPDIEASGPSTAIPDSGLAAALAAAMDQRRATRAPDPKLDTFLERQTRLIDLQTEHLHEQRAVILARLRLGRFSDWVKAILQVMTMVVGLVIAGALAVMAWQAHEDHGLTIAAFSAPPDLAQRGMTGQVVAARVLDRLSKLQAQTVSARPASTYANDWGDDIKVEIPETGVSIGELNRYLRQWLGSETHVAGEVVRTPMGFQVTARAGTASGQTVEGPESDIDGLIQQAAEAIYAQTQPYRYAVYLASVNKTNEALQAYAHLADDSGADPKDRAWAYTGWATLLLARNDDPRGALDEVSQAIRLDPWIDYAYEIQRHAHDALGQDEYDLGIERAELRVLESGKAEGLSPEAARQKRDFVRGAFIPGQFGDFGQVAATLERDPLNLNLEGGGGASGRAFLASVVIKLHDVSRALRQYHQYQPRSLPPDLSIQAAEALDDWPLALDQLNRLPVSELSSVLVRPDKALLLIRLGRIAEAQTLISSTPLDCTECLTVRGTIAALSGDRKAADAWFRLYVHRVPDTGAYTDWGQALLFLHDPDAAIVELKEAHKLGPHYADPLEVWGEALMAKGDDAGAIPRFTEANKDAPRWGRNHLRWGEALMLSGKYAEARAQYEIANGLDLSVGDRAGLNVLLTRTATGPLHG